MSKPPRVGRFSYDDEVRYFLLPVNRKVVPVFNELANPPRLLIDLPGTEVSQVQKRVYAGALVREAILESGPTGGARATLFLARPITNHWKWKHSGNNLVVVFDHRPVIQPSPVAPSATPKPTVTSIPKPASSPSPVASKPGEAQKASVPSPAVRAGHLFAGTVFNINSGEPVPGVRVIAGNEQAVSDRDGRFELRGLSQGAHTVSVSASGFSAQTFSILVPDDKSISLNLVPSL